MRFIHCCLIILLLSCKTETNDKILSNTSDELSKDAETEIKKVISAQEIAWNNHDLEEFMKGYWQSDMLKFYSTSGLTLGWQKTLENYKKNYPTTAESGTLKFTINDIAKIENETYWVMGEYHLSRAIGDANGVFMIIFKMINGQWKIIADMSC